MPKESSKSPPDQIVATYAAAARAAAIAYQQPLSSAAEVFLSAAASAVESLANGTGQGITTAKNRTLQRREPVISTVYSVSGGGKTSIAKSSATAALTKSESGVKPPLSWSSTWTRIVDRQSDVVVYIS